MTRAAVGAALASLLLAGCSDYYRHQTIDGKEYQCRYTRKDGPPHLIECVPLKAFIRETPKECAGE